MSIIINNNNKEKENPFVLMVLTLFIALTFIIPVSLPMESLAIMSSAEALLMGNGEIVSNSISWDEFQQWMINDTTMYREYSDTYNCVQFSNDLRNNAQVNGIKIYSVAVLEKNKNNHAINYGCFMSEDESTCALIEAQTGEIFFNVSEYIHLNDKWDIVSITIKEGELEKNERSIKRIY